MTGTERKLAAALLRMASEHYSNHGCNDLDLIADCGLTEAEGKEIARAMDRRTKADDPAYDGPGKDPRCCMDWMVMEMIADKLDGGV